MLKHFAAVKAHLVAQLPTAVTVEDTAVLNTDGSLKRAQYVILFGGGPESLGDDRVTAPQRSDSSAEYLYTVRCVAVTADGVRGVAQKVLDALVRARLSVDGRRCDPIILDGSGVVEADNAVKPPLWYLELDFVLMSHRA